MKTAITATENVEAKRLWLAFGRWRLKSRLWKSREFWVENAGNDIPIPSKNNQAASADSRRRRCVGREHASAHLQNMSHGKHDQRAQYTVSCLKVRRSYDLRQLPRNKSGTHQLQGPFEYNVWKTEAACQTNWLNLYTLWFHHQANIHSAPNLGKGPRIWNRHPLSIRRLRGSFW